MTTQTTDGQTSTRASRRAGQAPGGFPAPPGPTGDRLPVPTRQRRPGLAALAVLLILGGSALSGFLVFTSGQKKDVLVLARDVAYGHQFTNDDFREAQVAFSSDLQPVLVSQLPELVSNGYRARQALSAGSVLTFGMITTEVEVPAGDYLQAGIVAEDGHYPVEGLSPGDTVKVLYTPRSSEGANAGGIKGIPLNPGTTLVKKAYVKDVQRIEGGDDTGVWITLLMENTELTKGQTEGLPILQAANAIRALSVQKFPESATSETGSGSR
jgi:hypothetical protein